MLRTTLRHIEVFVATAQKGNVTQAAASIGLTQSAASMALADFENQLGVRLFDRIGKRLSLNDNGRALYPRAVRMVDGAQELEAMFRRDAGAVDLRLGASSTIGNYLLPRLIGEFNASRPGSRIRLEVSNTRKVIDAVRHFEVDIGFVEGPCFDPELDAAFWQNDALGIYSAPGHALALRPEPDSAALQRADWILRERGSGTREVVDQMLASQLGPVNVAMELGGTEAIKRAVESGMGISCLPTIAVDEAVRLGRLVLLPTPMLRLTRAFYILLHKEKYRTAGIDAFLALCRDADGGVMTIAAATPAQSVGMAS